MGSSQSKRRPTAQEAADTERKRQAALLYNRGVLVPPSFGTACDVVPPPSSSSRASSGGGSSFGTCGGGCGSVAAAAVRVTSSLPHLALVSYVPSLGSCGGSSSCGVVSSVLDRSAHARLLGSEHLLPGLWVSAGTPDGGGNVTAGWARGGIGGGGAGGTASGPESGSVAMNSAASAAAAGTGFLSGAILRPNARHTTLSGVGGTVSTSTSRATSSSALSGSISAFAARNLAGGIVAGYVSAVGSEGGGKANGLDGVPSSDADACPSRSDGGDAVLDNRRGSSAGGSRSNVRLGWSFSRSISLAGASGGDGEEYYRNDPFRDGASSGTQSERSSGDGVGEASPVRVQVGSSALLSDSPPSSLSSTGSGIGLAEASSHVTISAPDRGLDCAVEATIPTASFRPQQIGPPTGPSRYGVTNTLEEMRGMRLRPAVSGYVSFDLNKVGREGTDAVEGESQDGPPIVVTLHRLNSDHHGGSSSETAATVSQILTFDRIVTNPLENRCPKIRNTVAWAVRMKRSSIDDVPPSPSSEPSRSSPPPTSQTTLTAALSYQLNRSVCYKVQVDSGQGLTFGLLLKRWAHPRVTASLLFGTNAGSEGGGYGRAPNLVGFKGLGLQIESGPLPHGGGGGDALAAPPGTVKVGGDWIYGAAGLGGRGQGSGEVPPTRAELPPDAV